MNAINELGKQISALFATMTPAARVMAGLMLAVIVVSLGWILNASNTTQYEYLFGGRSFSDSELESWEATFGESELRDYERIGKRIRVPAGQKDLYLKALSSANVLPKESGSFLDAAIDAGSPFDPMAVREFRHETARERELAASIKRIPGIEYALVEYDEHRSGFARNTEKVCSIMVQGHANARIPNEKLQAIARSVETYFAGLRKENITVTDLGSSLSYRPSSSPDASDENPYLKAQLEFENSYHEKISKILEGPYGVFQLGVNVKLDPKLKEESEQLKYDPTAVTLQSSETRHDLDNIKAPPAGPPGAASNGVSNQPLSINSTAANQSSKSKQSEANERRVAGHEATVTKLAPMTPLMVNVSVGLPDSYYDKIWAIRFHRENPDQQDQTPPRPSALELANLKTETENAVRAAVEGIPVGMRQGDESKTFVKVYSYTDLPIPELPEVSMAESYLLWLRESWSTLGLMALVLLSLGLMFSWVRSPAKQTQLDPRFSDGFGLEIPESLADELELSSGDGQPAGDGSLSASPRAKANFDLSGEDIQDDLSALIKENPGAAVNLLKSWIGEAA